MNEKIHVGMLIGSLSRGGSERVMINIGRHLVSKGNKVTIVTQFKADEEYDVPEGIDRIVFGLSDDELTGNRVKDIKGRLDKLTRVWQDIQPDVILSFIGKNNFMAIRTGHKLGIPVVVSIRAIKSMEYYNPVMNFLADNYLNKAEAVVFQGKKVAYDFPAKVRKKAVILKNPVNRAFFEVEQSLVRDKTIVSVGRIDSEKNHKMLIEAFMGIADKYPDWKLIIYGDGDLRDNLISYVTEKGLSGRISLPGISKNVAEDIKNAGIFVLSTNCEGYPNALIEAMILGLPCISTDCPAGGPAELIKHGENGLLTPVKDVRQLQDNLQILLDDGKKREAFGERAKETAVIYKPETILGNWEELLLDIACKKPVNPELERP